MKFSQAGIDLLKQLEGCRLAVYKDSAGYPTIGVGHLIKPGEHFTAITMAQAEDILRADIAPAELAVNGAVKGSLSQNQFDALVCLAFNIGVTAFARSTLVRKLNEGDTSGAAAQFLVWVKAGGRVVQGLVNRRNKERVLFLTP